MHEAYNTKTQDYDKHAGHSAAMFRNKFWVCLFLTIPVLIYSASIQRFLDFTPLSFTGSKYIPILFSTIIFIYGGWIFIKGAYQEIKFRMPGMMTLISLAIITAYVYSLVSTYYFLGQEFFWELSTLITIMLLGHWMEMRSIGRAEGALKEIAKLLPDKADKVIDGQTKTVLVSELLVGDRILVRPGGSIPADGIVVKGSSSVNEAAVTGESKLLQKNINDEVIAGTINQEGSLIVKVTKLGDETILAGIMRLVSEAQKSKSQTQVLADKAAFWLTLIAIAAGVLTFTIWLGLKGSLFGLERAVTVLVIACPHAMGLAVPLVVSISTTLSAHNGLLVRKRLALESARNLDWVLFDKTGTLTRGEHGVTDIWSAELAGEKKVLQLVGSLEQASEHIIGKGIIKKVKEKKLSLLRISDFKSIPGVGVKAQIGQELYLVVNAGYIKQNSIEIPTELKGLLKLVRKQGKTEVYLLKNEKIIGFIALADFLRNESLKAIKDLQALGIKVAMITGDSKAVAEYISEKLSLDQVFAEVKPADKASKVKELQAGNQQVAMVGDGINDAPALTQANIGIAIGAGTDVAIKSADIILMKNNPLDVVKIIIISKATYRKMVQNLLWATSYNVVAIPLAAGVLYGLGISLSPAIGAILMSLSTVIVAVNAQTLRRLKLDSSL